jgi:hypothetical protein
MYYQLDRRETLGDLAAQIETFTTLALAGQTPNVFAAAFPQYQIFSAWGPVGSIPGHWVGRTAQQTVIGIMGASSAQMFSDLFRGAFSPANPLDYPRLNPCTIVPERQILADYFSTGLAPSHDLVVAGHSYGGALAQIVAARLRAQVPNSKVQCLSLGAPRIADGSLNDQLHDVSLARIFNEGDLIVRFPPHLDEAPIAMLALGLAVTLAFNVYVQPGGGLVLDSLGDLREQDVPVLNWPIQDANLLTWLAGANGYGSNEHSYKTYAKRLKVILPQPIEPFVGGPETRLKGELAPVVDQADFNLAGAMQLFLNGGRIMAFSSVYVPVQYRWTFSRLGDTWYLYWMGLQVGAAQTKSSAKTICKAANRWLRYMQNAKRIDHTDIGTALQLYLGVAGSASTGFMPVLTVT